MLRKIVTSVTILLLSVGGAESARLRVEGTAEVDQGSGFVQAADNIELLPGERIRVVSGTVSISYENGCSVGINTGQVAVVLSTPPACGQTNEIPQTALVIGGLAIAGGIGGGIALSQKGGKPASP